LIIRPDVLVAFLSPSMIAPYLSSRLRFSRILCLAISAKHFDPPWSLVFVDDCYLWSPKLQIRTGRLRHQASPCMTSPSRGTPPAPLFFSLFFIPFLLLVPPPLLFFPFSPFFPSLFSLSHAPSLILFRAALCPMPHV